MWFYSDNTYTKKIGPIIINIDETGDDFIISDVSNGYVYIDACQNLVAAKGRAKRYIRELNLRKLQEV